MTIRLFEGLSIVLYNHFLVNRGDNGMVTITKKNIGDVQK